MFRSLFAFALAVSLLAGCSADVELPPDEAATIEEDEGGLVLDTAVTDVDLNADLATVRVRAGVLTVWIEPAVRREEREGREVHVLRGRTSRRLRELSTFIHEDGFADARVLTPTTFEIVLRSHHELNSMLAGLPLFVRFVTVSGVPSEHQARLLIAPRMAKVDGPGWIRFEAPVVPIAVRDDAEPLRYRGRIVTAQTPRSLSIEPIGPAASARVSPRAFRFDLTFRELLALTQSMLVARAEVSSSHVARARAQFVVSSLGLTTRSAARVWPPAECAPAVDACVARHGDARELSACGSYREVQPCLDNRLR